MTTKHTPGPWTINVDDDIEAVSVLGANNRGLAAVAGHTFNERRANGHLIAAAPDLLKLAEALVQSWEATADGCQAVRHNDGTVINVRALIAKAAPCP